MNVKMIYVVDDEERIRELIKSYLEKEGFSVCVFHDGNSALEAFNINTPDMLVIDIMMPGMDGYTLLREIRKKSNVPVIVVSAKDDEIDRVLGLELGSDDYISKPFSPRELVARVKTIFRRIGRDDSDNEEKQDVIRCGDMICNKEERSVSVNGQFLELTVKEFDFIIYLSVNKNRVLTREQLLNAVWGYDFMGDTRVVDDIVKRVRKKLIIYESILKIITVWGYGYKLIEE